MLTLPPLALYIHIPWCVRKCPYCDFNSHAANGALPEEQYVAALLADLEQDLPRVWGRVVSSIFFGGGTPSLFSAHAIGAILDGVRGRLKLKPDAEITLETNPGTSEHGHFDGYRAAGVNRLSIGAQSFDDVQLKTLGRIHCANETERAVSLARAAGFDNYNLDLMYALPGQTLAQAVEDVDRALALAPNHLSHYQLTIEPQTEFAARPPSQLPDADRAWEIEQAAIARMSSAGFSRYEVSAYAKPNHASQHNLNYWRFGDYLGIGAGAHGKITDLATGLITRTVKFKSPKSYLARLDEGQFLSEQRVLGPTELPFEYMLNALRLVEGFALEDFERRTGLDRNAVRDTIESACTDGLLTIAQNRVTPTALGFNHQNALIQRFL
jgi:putative oxygen-independent coproporphyrinogen III oxidase